MQKRKRGGQTGNQNAKKTPEQIRRKDYYPTYFFGQRWAYEEGEQIEKFLAAHGLTQKAYLTPFLEHDIFAPVQTIAFECSDELFQALSLAAIDHGEDSAHQYARKFLEQAHQE